MPLSPQHLSLEALHSAAQPAPGLLARLAALFFDGPLSEEADQSERPETEGFFVLMDNFA